MPTIELSMLINTKNTPMNGPVVVSLAKFLVSISLHHHSITAPIIITIPPFYIQHFINK